MHKIVSWEWLGVERRDLVRWNRLKISGLLHLLVPYEHDGNMINMTMNSGFLAITPEPYGDEGSFQVCWNRQDRPVLLMYSMTYEHDANMIFHDATMITVFFPVFRR